MARLAVYIILKQIYFGSTHQVKDIAGVGELGGGVERPQMPEMHKICQSQYERNPIEMQMANHSRKMEK